MQNVICCLKVHRHPTTFFRLKSVLIITQLHKRSPENLKSGLCFASFMYHKKQNLRFYSCQQYWSSENICLELKVWMSSFLDIRSSGPKVFLKILKNSLKNIHDAFFNLLKLYYNNNATLIKTGLWHKHLWTTASKFSNIWR